MKKYYKSLMLFIVITYMAGILAGCDGVEESSLKSDSSSEIVSTDTPKPTSMPTPKRTPKPTKKPILKKKRIGFYISCEENLFFSKYNVNVFLDGKKLRMMSNGKRIGFYKKIRQGKHKLTLSKEGDKSLSTDLYFVVSKSEVFYIAYKTKRNEIRAEIMQNEKTKGELNELIKENATPAPTKAAKNSLSKKKAKRVKKEMSREEFINSCQMYDFKTVLRNPEQYKGQHIYVTCRISSSSKTFWKGVPYYWCEGWDDELQDYYGDNYYVLDKRSDSSTKLLNNDVITVYGIISEPEGGNGNILAIDMKYAEIIYE